MTAEDWKNVQRREMGRRLRQLRESKGLSQAEAARSVDMSPANLSRIETGKQGTTEPHLRRLVEIGLGATMVDLYSIDISATEPEPAA